MDSCFKTNGATGVALGEQRARNIQASAGADAPKKIWLLKKIGCSAEIDRLMVFHRIMEDMRTKEHAQMFRARHGYY